MAWRPPGGLGRQVGWRVTGPLRAGHRLQRRCHAKVHHPRMALVVHQDIGRLEAPVHDASRMGDLQAVEHIHHQRHGVVGRAPALLRQVFRQGPARHILEHNLGLAPLHIGFKHRHDEGVGQRTHVARLAQPGVQRQSILVLHRAHELDGHLALQAGIEGQPHRGLGAAPQHPQQFKAAQHGRRLVPSPRNQAFGGGKRGKIGHGVRAKTGRRTARHPEAPILCLRHAHPRQ